MQINLKPSSKRKYAPKIIQHLIVSFSHLIISILMLLFFINVYLSNDETTVDFYTIINNTTNKIILVAIIANYLISLVCLIMIWFLQVKTDDGRILVIFETVFAICLLTCVFCLIFSVLALKTNELVYE